MAQKLLTIIVPTYNMEAYLNRCLDSLIIDKKNLSLLDIIVVNDGSKDKSSEIAHSYQDRYPEVFCVIDKENGNYGSTINCALKEAKGKYIRILDSDDWFNTQRFSEYLEKLKTLDVDLIITDFEQVNNNGCTIKAFSYKLPHNILLPFQEIEDAEYYGLPSLTYKTQILLDMNYRQTEGISYSDTEWVYYPQTRVLQTIYLPISVYRYFIGREGQTMDPKVLLKSVNHYTQLIRKMIEFSDQLPESYKKRKSFNRLESQIQHLSEGVYKTCLISQDKSFFDASLLLNFDNLLKEKRFLMYKAIAKLTLKPHIPLHYVRFWRITGHRLSLDFIRDTYRKIRYGKK